MTAIHTGFPVILNNGVGLEGGQLFIGVYGQDPVSYPQQVYWDAALTIPASQPLSIQGGYIRRYGTPATAYVAADWSARCLDSYGAQIWYTPNAGTVSTTTAGSANPYDVRTTIPGSGLTNGALIDGMFVVRPFTWAAGLAGSGGSVFGVPPASTYTISIRKNGLLIAQVAVSTAGTFSFSTFGLPVSWALNDVMIQQGGPAESALSDWFYTLKGTRT